MLKGRSALVMGSLGGIGFATAKALAGLGCDVVLNGFAGDETVAAPVAEIQAQGVRAAHRNADLRDPAQIADMVSFATTAHGAPDILVDNAVVRYFGLVENFAPKHWGEALAVNLSAPFHAIRLTLSAMKTRGWGRIVNMASIYSHFATVNRIDDIATKTALLGLTRAVALECAKTCVICNAICPGTVLTPAIEGRMRQETQRDGTTFEQAETAFLSTRQPSGRFVKDESVVGPIAFLCGPYGADIAGADLPIDGG